MQTMWLALWTLLAGLSLASGAAARCPEGDLACPGQVVEQADRGRAPATSDSTVFSELSDLSDLNTYREPPPERDDASGGVDLMTLHPVGNILWVRW